MSPNNDQKNHDMVLLASVAISCKLNTIEVLIFKALFKPYASFSQWIMH